MFKRKIELFVGLAALMLVIIGTLFVLNYSGYSAKHTGTNIQAWKTYKNNVKYKYQISYPATWKANPMVILINDESVGLGPGGSSTEGVKVECPPDANGTILPNPKSIYMTGYTGEPMCVSYLTVNGMKAVQWIIEGQINTSVLRSSAPLVCNLVSNIVSGTEDTKNCAATIKAQTIYNQVLDTFEFTK